MDFVILDKTKNKLKPQGPLEASNSKQDPQHLAHWQVCCRIRV